MALPNPDAIQEMNKVLDSGIKLINDLLSHLESLEAEPETARNPENAKIASIGIAHDAAALIKAHSTKISLFIINEPFTPTAITKVLRELFETAIPSLVSAAAACEASRYTQGFSQEMRFRCRRLLKSLRGLIQYVPRNGKVLDKDRKEGTSDGKGSMVATSVLWAACDEITSLRTLGVRGLLVQKLNQHRAILDDIKEELKEWKEENENADLESQKENDNNSNNDNEGNRPIFENDTYDDAQAVLDDFMSTQKIPKDRTDIRNQLQPCITRLGLLSLLYKAVGKRRFAELPEKIPADSSAASSSSDSEICEEETNEIVKRVNDVYPILHDLPDNFGNLVSAFYKLDTPLIESARAQCFRGACRAADLLKRPWAGAESDAFSGWIEKFLDQMNTPTGGNT